jgi:hypothetical protein
VCDHLVLFRCRGVRQAARDRTQQVDCRKPAALGDLAVQHDMAIKHAAQDVGHRLIHVGARNQNAEHGSDVAGTFRPGARALGQRSNHVRHGRRIAAQTSRFACRQSHLAMGFGKTGYRIGQQQHVAASIPEVLGHRHRGPGGTPANQRRLIGGGGDHDRARHALGAEHPFGELTQLPAAFADQCDNHDVGMDAACEPGEQHRLADAGAGEQAESLTPHQRQQCVERRQPGIEPLPHRLAPRCWRGRCPQGPWLRAARQRSSVKRSAEGIDDASDPAAMWIHVIVADQLHPITYGGPFG